MRRDVRVPIIELDCYTCQAKSYFIGKENREKKVEIIPIKIFTENPLISVTFLPSSQAIITVGTLRQVDVSVEITRYKSRPFLNCNRKSQLSAWCYLKKG